MSARVLNPAMMTEISRNLSSGGGGGAGGGRAAPSRAALARVRRDLFGPVDHAAARDLAERELQAQSQLDADRWGFNFQVGAPLQSNSRYEWEPLTEHDVVPEPYALRGMPYLRKHAPGTPRKLRFDDASTAAAAVATTAPTTSPTSSTATTTPLTTIMTTVTTMPSTRIIEQMETVVTPTAERTPPQEPRVPEIGEVTMPNQLLETDTKRKRCAIEPTTPVLPSTARKQSSITDYMKSRKRGLNGTTKSMIEPPEKITRNAGQIRS
ncbi:PREDICTED: cyclin-dependent kinase inhibitor 1C [Wasmannia auropunctata]|uniref:cyclin-dependent kinase inhibitor 1C n=1 Tax=Wasmannia auropunctata TaxID=64793 RepID=UPI0005EF59E2|nr:PREDICTED: cyclin-dependent kinase inhibitor 1C [Wasmannia auropunctata]